MAQLPLPNPPNQILTRWKSALDPILALPLNNSNFIQNLTLESGANSINHGLGRKPQGWIVADSNASVTIYRSAAFNALTLTLTSSAIVTVSLVVF